MNPMQKEWFEQSIRFQPLDKKLYPQFAAMFQITGDEVAQLLPMIDSCPIDFKDGMFFQFHHSAPPDLLAKVFQHSGIRSYVHAQFKPVR